MRLTASFIGAADEIDAVDWDACAGGGNPFIGRAYLQALEQGGVVVPERGWFPRHMTMRDDDGRVQAVAPLYLKTNSDDEYMSDQDWATGCRLAGGRYYPKFLSAAPFAPVGGRRFLVRPGAPPQTAEAMVKALEHAARGNGISSIHAAFVDEHDARLLETAGWLPRCDVQFHWTNAGYRDFDDFLSTLTARKRWKIIRERRLATAGTTFRTLTGDEMRVEDWEIFFRLFNAVHQRRQTPQRLTLRFFMLLGQALGARLKMEFADGPSGPVAAALRVLGDRRVYLRHWGCLPDRRHLHFEMSSYREIEYAVRRGFDVVEGGYGGAHKLERGFSPVLTRSMHWFADPGMRSAAAGYLAHERDQVMRRWADLCAAAPFRR